MEELARQQHGLACARPRIPKIADRFSVPVKHQRRERRRRSFNDPSLPLIAHRLRELALKRNHSPFARLGHAGIEPDSAGVQINLAPAKR